VRSRHRVDRRAGRSEAQSVLDLKACCAPDAILASNTSSISITRLAAATDRPDKFIGLHFMNPAPVMEVVEIIRGLGTSQETYDTSVAFIQSLGKNIANAEDFPAFIVNRVLMPMINEASTRCTKASARLKRSTRR
jgi:3-hydroxybutyryl-CoA dehydrogenase